MNTVVVCLTLIGSVIALQGIKVPLCTQQRERSAWIESQPQKLLALSGRPHSAIGAASASLALESEESTAHSHRAQLPLRIPWTDRVQHDMEVALNEIVSASPSVYSFDNGSDETVDSTARSDWRWHCTIPAFGDDCRLSVQRDANDRSRNGEGLVLTLQGRDVHDSDWYWICSQFQHQHDSSNNTSTTGGLHRLVSTHALRQILVDHHNRQPADAGVAASSAAWSLTSLEPDFERALLGGTNTLQSLWETLQTDGFIVIDQSDLTEANPLNTSSNQREALSSFLQETTGQGPSVRTDRVHFVTRPQAEACGISFHYDFCMGLAHYWNTMLPSDHLHNEPVMSQSEPMFPATIQAPYTIPRNLQFAEYGPGDFYTAHSDNSLTPVPGESNEPIRSNFRAYTCILYMNDNDWDAERDGGTLRLYPQSQHFTSPAEALAAAMTSRSPPFVDISPINGRLLIFDSCLVHSVQPNLSSSKLRRALTLWINRPDQSGVRGEQYY